MNTAYFDSTVSELNTIANYASNVASYATQAVAMATSAQAVNIVLNDAINELNNLFPQLTEKLDKATSDCSAMHGAISANLALLAPLMVSPTDLPSLITWAQAVINTYVGPQTNYLLQEAVIAEKLATIVADVGSITSSVTSTISAINAAANLRLSQLGGGIL